MSRKTSKQLKAALSTLASGKKRARSSNGDSHARSHFAEALAERGGGRMNDLFAQTGGEEEEEEESEVMSGPRHVRDNPLEEILPSGFVVYNFDPFLGTPAAGSAGTTWRVVRTVLKLPSGMSVNDEDVWDKITPGHIVLLIPESRWALVSGQQPVTSLTEAQKSAIEKTIQTLSFQEASLDSQKNQVIKERMLQVLEHVELLPGDKKEVVSKPKRGKQQKKEPLPHCHLVFAIRDKQGVIRTIPPLVLARLYMMDNRPARAGASAFRPWIQKEKSQNETESESEPVRTEEQDDSLFS